MSAQEAPIPFLDLLTPHKELEKEILDVVRKALSNAGFVGGPIIDQFEEDFSRFCDTKHCVGVGSGTDALRFALIAAGIRPGDVVLTVPNTFIATTEAITQTGALPEFVDIDERTFNLDAEKLREFLEAQCSISDNGKLLSRRNHRPVTAIIPVHIYGQMADMDPILELANRYRLIVVEDACQAHGAEYFSRQHNRWFKAGSMGRAAAFSFYPGKNLGACGEAGAVTTNDEVIADNIRMLRDHGQAQKYYHRMEGYNGRLDAIQAGILHSKLPHLPKWNSQRRERAAEYQRVFAVAGNTIKPPFEPSWSRAVYHLYVVRAQDRNGLLTFLKGKGIGTGIHYPIPLHLQQAYQSLHYVTGNFPVTEKVSAEIISLPMYPQLSQTQQLRVAEECGHFIERPACETLSAY